MTPLGTAAARWPWSGHRPFRGSRDRHQGFPLPKRRWIHFCPELSRRVSERGLPGCCVIPANPSCFGLDLLLGLLALTACVAPPKPHTLSQSSSSTSLQQYVPTLPSAPSQDPTHAAPSTIVPTLATSCQSLVRPNCKPRSSYGGSIDNLVALECSTLFDLGPELHLPAAPHRLADSFALLGPLPEQSATNAPLSDAALALVGQAQASWFTLNYSIERPYPEQLALKPAPGGIFGVVFDPSRPILLGKRHTSAARRPSLGLWVLGCSRHCAQVRHIPLNDPIDLEPIGVVRSEQKGQLLRMIEEQARAERHFACIQSSSGCHDEPSIPRAPVPPNQLGPSWKLPRAAVEVTLERETEGVVLVRRGMNGARLDRWLVLSADRAEHLEPPRLGEPVPVEAGYLVVLSSESGSVSAALIRLDVQGRLVGAPVLTATMDQGIWLGSCTNGTCLVAVAKGRSIVGQVLRVTSNTALPCESQATIRYSDAQ